MYQFKNKLKNRIADKTVFSWTQVLDPVILAIREVEIGRIPVKGQPGQKVSKTPKGKTTIVTNLKHPAYPVPCICAPNRYLFAGQQR
jgi:hypothetical protein